MEEHNSPLAGGSNPPQGQDNAPETLSNGTCNSIRARQRRKRRFHWGFMVVFGSFLCHVLLGGFNRCYGVIYLKLQEKFNSGAALTAGVGGLSTALRMGAGPFATAVSERIGGRLTVMIGGFLLGLGSILSSIITSTEMAFLTLGIMSGVGGALTYVPSLVIVGQYFDKARSRALGVATSGSGIGVFLFPLMLEAIFNFYGYQGGMVLLGGILFNTIVSGALYRPLKELVVKQELELQINTELDAKSKDHEEDLFGNVDNDVVQTQEEHEIKTDQAVKRNCPSWCTGISNKFGLYLLCDRAFLSYFITVGLSTGSYWPAQMLLPALATSRGHSTSHAMLLLSLLGAFDVIGRLGSGVLFDTPYVRKRRLLMYTIFIVISSLSQLSWPLTATSYPLLAIMVALNGLAGGTTVCQKTVVAADLVGIKRLAGGLGLVVFSQGVAVMICPLIAGYLRDVTASYTWSYVFLGSLGLASAAIFTVGAVLPTCRTKTMKQPDPS